MSKYTDLKRYFKNLIIFSEPSTYRDRLQEALDVIETLEKENELLKASVSHTSSRLEWLKEHPTLEARAETAEKELERVKKEFADFGKYHQQQIRDAHYDVDWGGPKNYGDKK